MTGRPSDELVGRGVVIFHEWLVGAGGAERLVVEAFRFFSAAGIPTRLLAFQVAPEALFGLPIECVEVVPRTSILDGIRQLRRRLLLYDPAVVVVSGGYNELYLATMGTGIPYVRLQHEPPYKIMLHQRQVVLPLIRRKEIQVIKAKAYGYRDESFGVAATSARQRLGIEIQAVLTYLSIRAAGAVAVLSWRAASEVQLLYGRGAICVRGCLDRSILTHHPKTAVLDQRLPSSRTVVLSIARLHPWKRIATLIQAFARISDEFENAIFMIGGVGPDEDALKSLSRELGLAHRVVFLGFVPDTALWDTMASCQVFVCADWADFDLAPYEALALGRKVVCSSEMEIDSELIEAGAVFQADPTVDDLAVAMRQALTSPDVERGALTGILDRYTWGSYFAKIVDIASSCTRNATRALLGGDHFSQQ